MRLTHCNALLNLEAKVHVPAVRTEEVAARQTHELVTGVALSAHRTPRAAANKRILLTQKSHSTGLVLPKIVTCNINALSD